MENLAQHVEERHRSPTRPAFLRDSFKLINRVQGGHCARMRGQTNFEFSVRVLKPRGDPHGRRKGQWVA